MQNIENIERLVFLNISATVTEYQTVKHAFLNTTVPKFSEKKLLKIFHKFQLALHEDLLLVTGVFPGNISI